MIATTETKLPRLLMSLPGPNAKRVVELDAQFMSPSFTRDYPLVAKRGRGAVVEDVDGNAFLDFARVSRFVRPDIAIRRLWKRSRSRRPS